MTGFELKDLPNPDTLECYTKWFPDMDVLSVNLCLKLLRNSTDMTSAFNHYFSKHSLSIGKFSILMLLFRNSNVGMSPSEIAMKAGITKATVTGLVDGLETSDLIVRQCDAVDRRKTIVTLTDQGQKLLEHILPNHFIRAQRLMSSLTLEEKKEMMMYLNRIEERIKKSMNEEC